MKKLGRPRKFNAAARKKIARLIRKHKSLVYAHEVLSVPKGPVGLTKDQRVLVAHRKEIGIDGPIEISLPTLHIIAKEAEIKLKRGPRGPRNGA